MHICKKHYTHYHNIRYITSPTRRRDVPKLELWSSILCIHTWWNKFIGHYYCVLKVWPFQKVKINKKRKTFEVKEQTVKYTTRKCLKIRSLQILMSFILRIVLYKHITEAYLCIKHYMVSQGIFFTFIELS